MIRSRLRAALRGLGLAALGAAVAVATYLFLPWPEPAGRGPGPGEAERATAAFFARLEAGRVRPPAGGRVLEVEPGSAIQATLDGASPGDTVVVPPGVYHESLRLERPGVALVGREGGEAPVLDGRGLLPTGVVGSASGVAVRGLALRGFTGTVVRLEEGRGLRVEELAVEDAGVHGIHVVAAVDVVVVGCRVSGARGAAVLVEQARGVEVAGNRLRDAPVGVALLNVTQGRVVENEIYDNGTGVVLATLPGGPSRLGRGLAVVGNRLYGNDRPPAVGTGGLIGRLPAGGGVVALAVAEVEIADNEIVGHPSFGVLVAGLDSVAGAADGGYDVAPDPRACRVLGNRLADNGGAPAPALARAGLPGADLLWDLTGRGHGWEQPGASRWPPLLPAPGWRPAAERANTRWWRLAAALGIAGDPQADSPR